MTKIQSQPTDAHEPPVDPVLQGGQQQQQPQPSEVPELHPEQDPVARPPEGLPDAEPPEALT